MKKMLIMLLSAILVLSAVGCSQTPPDVPDDVDVSNGTTVSDVPDDTDDQTETDETEGQLLDYDNYDEFVADIYLCDDVYRSKDTPTHGTASIKLPMAQDVLELKDYDVLLCGDGCDPAAVVSRASQGYAPAFRIVSDGETDGNFKILKFKAEIPEGMLEDLKRSGTYEQLIEKLGGQYYYLLVLDEKHYAYIALERKEGAEKTEDEAELADDIVKNAKINFAPIAAVRDGFKNQTVSFAYQMPDGGSEMICLRIALPEDWSVDSGHKTYEVIPFQKYADLKKGEDYVGGIGFLPYDIPEDQDVPIEGIFNQIAMGSMTFWNVRQHFDVVTEDELVYKTALTSVLYAGKIFPDGKERTNSGIVSYHPDFKMYIALELTDGTKDREILTDEEIRYIAESIEWLSDGSKAEGTEQSIDGWTQYTEKLKADTENQYEISFIIPDEWGITVQDNSGGILYDSDGKKRIGERVLQTITFEDYSNGVLSDSSGNGVVKNSESPYTGTTDSGVEYMGFHTSVFSSAEKYDYLLKYSDNLSLYFSVWTHSGDRYDDFYNSIVVPIIRSVDITKIFTSDDAVALLKEQLIAAYENTYGEYTPSDEEPTTFTDDGERLRYIIPRLTVKEETDEYYIIPVIWDFYIDKETREIFKYYNGLDDMLIPFDPQSDTALSFAG